jgi:hypothetical protein
MYIRTRDGLGQGQTTWSTLQTFNRPTAQPRPISYLGNFNERIGKAESKPCKETWAVWGFNPNSAKLLDFQKKHINDIATRLVSLFKLDLEGKRAGVRVDFLLEGHVDKKTDSAQYGKLDLQRAKAVADELDKQIPAMNDRLMVPIHASFRYSQAGLTRPVSSDSKKNRRAVVCVRWKLETP